MLNSSVLLAALGCLFFSLILTPLISRLAVFIGAVDSPNQRKVHQVPTPRLGGLAIYLSFLAGLLLLPFELPYQGSILLSSLIIVVTGVLDDLYELSPALKLVGQGFSAFVLVFNGLVIDHLTFPFVGFLDLGILSYPITILWILGLINAINLIDGLDGLAGGVSTIAMVTISLMAITKGQFAVVVLCLIIASSTLGFLFYNFYPAKIFMGDTGSQLLGLLLAIVSIMGFFKSITFISLLVPVFILGVPFLDTGFAIIRRLANKQKWSHPDKSHLHHRLLAMGFSHPVTVILIYFMSIFFSLMAFMFSIVTVKLAIILFILSIIVVQFTAELLGLIGQKTPLLNILQKWMLIVNKKNNS